MAKETKKSAGDTPREVGFIEAETLKEFGEKLEESQKFEPMNPTEDKVVPAAKQRKEIRVVEVDELSYSRVRKVKEPNRGTSRSAGIDMFVPEFDDAFKKALFSKNEKLIDDDEVKDERILNKAFGGRAVYFDKIVDSEGNVVREPYILLRSNTSVNIPSGVHYNLPANTALFVMNKSGVASKKELTKLAELVDEDYQGEVHINVSNVGNTEVMISPNEKLIQLVLVPILYSMPKEVPFENLYPSKTDRGTKGFGEATGNE
jgi:dUTPase